MYLPQTLSSRHVNSYAGFGSISDIIHLYTRRPVPIQWRGLVSTPHNSQLYSWQIPQYYWHLKIYRRSYNQLKVCLDPRYLLRMLWESEKRFRYVHSIVALESSATEPSWQHLSINSTTMSPYDLGTVPPAIYLFRIKQLSPITVPLWHLSLPFTHSGSRLRTGQSYDHPRFGVCLHSYISV